MKGKISRSTSKKRNVSETTVTSSNENGSFAGDFEYFSAENPSSEREMDRYSSTSCSDSEDDTYKNESRRRNSQKPKCSSKNAILARRNRIKKKKYLEDLENEVKSLRAENSALRINVEGYSKDMDVVRKENRYLRNVLASRREISRLLGVINDKTGLATSSSLCKTNVPRNLPNNDKATQSQSHSNYVHNNEPPVIVSPPRDSEIVTQDESMESPITLKDVSLLGIDFDDDSLIPLNLFSSGDHDYLNFDTDIPEDWLAGDEELPNIGVCLHVAKQKVSLEFCQHCNENASRSWVGAES